MENPILITWLNDFIFCPISIYFHNLYGDTNRLSFQDTCQINGSDAHKKIDSGSYSTKSSIISGQPVFCEKYGLTGKIDLFYSETGELVERKKKIVNIYDGFVFQMYAQYFSLIEMGYKVTKLTMRSLDDNKIYLLSLPKDNPEMFKKFENVIDEIKNFQINNYKQSNIEKCKHCIYEPLCDSSLLVKEDEKC